MVPGVKVQKIRTKWCMVQDTWKPVTLWVVKILEGFLKKVTLRWGFGGCIGIYVKWISISEDSELVGGN